MSFLVRCRIPREDLGRVSLPKQRMRYADGWVRVGWSRDKTQVIATLEDREGSVVPQASQVEAVAQAYRMGHAISLLLLEHNRQYCIGEKTA